MAEQDKPSFFHDFVEVLKDEFSAVKTPTLGELATIFIAAATVVVGMGAALFWIRAGNAGLPQLQTVTLIPQQEFVSLGVRELALPMAFWSTVNLLLFALGGARGTRRARAERAPSKWTGGALIGVLRGVGFAFLFFYPLAWRNVVGALILLFYSVLLEHPRLFNIKVVVILSAAVSLATGLAKEADAPIRMDHAVVELARGKSVSGLYIASTNGFTYLGINGEIEGLSNRGVTSLRLSHPPEKKAGSPESIADRVFDAVTGLF